MIYELKLLSHMKIYPVILIINFKPLPPGEDLYRCPHDNYSSTVKKENRSKE